MIAGFLGGRLFPSRVLEVSLQGVVVRINCSWSVERRLVMVGHGMIGVWMCTQYYSFFANMFSTLYTGQRTAEGRLRLSGVAVDAFVY